MTVPVGAPLDPPPALPPSGAVAADYHMVAILDRSGDVIESEKAIPGGKKNANERRH